MRDSPLDADDAEIEASRAPLMDHLTELRMRLLWACGAVLIGTTFSYLFAQKIYLFLAEPYRVAAARAHGASLADESVQMQATHPFEIFFTNLKLSLFAGIILAFPVITYHLYAFIAPGLYKRERKAVTPFLVAAPVMFGLGCAFVYYVAMPFAMQFALGLTVSEGPVQIQLNAKVNEYFSLVTTLILAFGLCFQLPVVLALLGRAEIVTAAMLRKGRRYAIVGIAALSACVTPPDPISMFIMAIPIYLLYEISIWIVAAMQRNQSKTEASTAVTTAPAE